MQILSNKTTYQVTELVRLAQRENNTKRGYLLVDPLQAKHMPVAPSKVLDLFRQLGEQARKACPETCVAVVGFAETATAIGAAVAECFGDSALYLHTTREPMNDVEKLVDFEEEHSHATEQKLYCAGGAEALKNIERVIFVEDEITTGKTILNFVRALRKCGCFAGQVQFTAVSLLNSMKAEDEERFVQNGVEWDCLVKLQADFANAVFPQIPPWEDAVGSAYPAFQMTHIQGKADPRSGVTVGEYKLACERLSQEVLSVFEKSLRGCKRVLVLGTEECMYPAVFSAAVLEKRFPGCEVRTHSTTRSPIAPCNTEDYPLFMRRRLRSVYDDTRTTFLYNLTDYDAAVVISDTPQNGGGWKDLAAALSLAGTRKLLFVNWEVC